MQIVTRAEALEQGASHYFTGKPCRYGHLAERYTSDARCLECARDHTRKSRARNIEKRRAADREYARTHAEKRKRYRTQYHLANRERLIAENREWCRLHPDARKEHNRKYHAAKVRATPVWADRAAIDEFYERRPDGYEVDHIVPLQGKNVCGLHVVWNLQYLTPSENQAKGNTCAVQSGASGGR